MVYGKGQIHDVRLEKLLERLQSYGLTLRKEKCVFGVPEVKWFGMIFGVCTGNESRPKKVQLIKDWPVPEDKAAVISFLQTCQFSQECMRPGQHRTFLYVTLPLRRLTAKAVRLRWTKECQQAFEELKGLLCSDTVVKNYDPNKKTRIYMDHGPAGLGGTIAQDHAELGENPLGSQYTTPEGIDRG